MSGPATGGAGYEAEVADETDGAVYVFRGDDEAHVDDLIERWADNGERTWAATRPADDAAGFSLDDVEAHIEPNVSP